MYEDNDEENKKRCKNDESINVDDIKYKLKLNKLRILCWFISNFSFEEFKNRIVVHTIESIESCTHEVAYPPGQPYIPLQASRTEPAKSYSFTLDPFQKESILCVDNGQSVLVSAHTSAGKTVVAE